VALRPSHPGVELLVALDEAGFNHLAAPVALWRRGVATSAWSKSQWPGRPRVGRSHSPRCATSTPATGPRRCGRRLRQRGTRPRRDDRPDARVARAGVRSARRERGRTPRHRRHPAAHRGPEPPRDPGPRHGGRGAAHGGDPLTTIRTHGISASSGWRAPTRAGWSPTPCPAATARAASAPSSARRSKTSPTCLVVPPGRPRRCPRARAQRLRLAHRPGEGLGGPQPARLSRRLPGDGGIGGLVPADREMVRNLVGVLELERAAERGSRPGD